MQDTSKHLCRFKKNKLSSAIRAGYKMEDDEQKPWLDGTLSCHLSSERVTWQHYIVNVGLRVPKKTTLDHPQERHEHARNSCIQFDSGRLDLVPASFF